MRVYNTLTRHKEELIAQNGNEIRIYSCGPTVYGFAHIGNLRTYIFMDILRRVLRYKGYTLKHVMNITDVGHLVSDADEGEDKMMKTAKEQCKSPYEIAEYYTDVFFKDIAALNIEEPEVIPRATGHIAEMIEFVEGLLEKGFAYETSDGIYFDISKFDGYGKLSGINLEEQLAGARVEVNQEKRHPADFALWKKAPKEHIMQWPSPWGMGYPGWHIECSAMSRKYLGDRFEIHTGGVDHIPVHHENEIAQSEALIGVRMVDYWMHGEFLLVDGGKMSKSLGNTYTIAQLKEKNYNPLAFRYFCLNAHYRSKLNFTWEAMHAAQIAYNRLLEEAYLQKTGDEDVGQEIVVEFEKEFDEAISDDLNIPKALGVVWSIIRYPGKSKVLFELLLKMDCILGLDIAKSAPKADHTVDIDPEIQKLVDERQRARHDKNWKLADEIRNRLKEMDIILEDTPQGVKVVRKSN